MPAKICKFSSIHKDLNEQVFLLQRQYDEYDRLLNSFAITKDAIPNETHNDINQMVNFIENSGLVFTDMSFLMEWYILKQEKCVAKEIALAKLRYNIAELEMRASYATDEYSNAERAINDAKHSITRDGNIDAMLKETKKENELLAVKKAAVCKKVAFNIDELLMKLEQLPK